MKGRRRVLLVTDWFQKYAAEQAEGLVEAGAEVLWLSTRREAEFGEREEERRAALDHARAAGVEVIDIVAAQKRTTVAEIRRLRRAVRQWRPDVAHVHWNTDLRLLWLARGVPVAYLVHDPVHHPGQTGLRSIRPYVDKA